MPAISMTLATGNRYNLRKLFEADPSAPPTGVTNLKGDTTAGAYFPTHWAEVIVQNDPLQSGGGTIRVGGAALPTDGLSGGTAIIAGESMDILHAARTTIALGNTYLAVTASTVVNIDVH